MWALILENSNHPNERIVILKSSCKPMLEQAMWNLFQGFKKMQYKSFKIYLQSIDSGGIITEVSHANRSRI